MRQTTITARDPRKIGMNKCSGNIKTIPPAMRATTFNTFEIARFSKVKLYHHPRTRI
jgi:hypothetical protein